MPMSRAASASCDTARMALPTRVRRTTNCSSSISDTEMPTITSCRFVTTTPPTVYEPARNGGNTDQTT